MDTTADSTTPVPTITDAFLADRMAFWGRFTKFVTYGAIAIALLLVVMAIFLT